MKKYKVSFFTQVITFVLVVLVSANAIAQVYKHTDEDGNVYYSDRKPFADAKEEKLKPVIVIPAKEYDNTSSNRRRQEHKKKKVAKEFSNFIIKTPVDGATLSGTGGGVLATVNLAEKLQSNYRIKFYIDGRPQGKVKSHSLLIKDIFRGEHTIYAELIDASTRRVILTTPKSIFHMKQHSKK